MRKIPIKRKNQFQANYLENLSKRKCQFKAFYKKKFESLTAKRNEKF